MNARRLILLGICLLLLVGLGNFVINAVQTRGQLAQVASDSPASQQTGVERLMARGSLFDALQGGAPAPTRLHAIAALKGIAQGGKQPDAFAQLLQMLKDPDTEAAQLKTHPVRDAAVDAVAEVGPQYPAALMDAAKDPDGTIKAQALAALKKIGPPFANQLASRLGDAALRAPFGDLLATFGPSSIPLITPYLQSPLLKTDAAPDDLSKAKIDLITTLGEFSATAAATPLLPFASDPDPNVRRAVVTSLANIDQPAGAPVLIAALRDTNFDPSARAAAAAALGAIATPEATAAMETALSDYDLSVADAAASGLKRAGAAAASAIAQALTGPDAHVRALAALATGGQATPALATKALTDADPTVRAAAADALSEVLLRNETAAAPAAPTAASNGASATATAVTPTAVAAVPATPPVPPAAITAELMPLVGALGDSDGAVAQAAERALGRLGSPAITPLVGSLASANETVAYYASQALATIGRPAEDAVLANAQPNSPSARWAAITLGQIGDPRAAPALKALGQSPDPNTAYAAQSALARVQPG